VSALGVAQIRRRFLVLHGLRWLPTGLLIPVTVLLMLERGLTLPQVGLVSAAQGLVILALELPTGGLADALGRKPVLVTAAAVGLVSTALLVVADSVPLLTAVWALQGVFRALDSGPLESWYVDSTLAADRSAEIERGLSAGGVVIGLSIAAGALLSGALVALGPIGPVSALTGPVVVAVALQLVALVALLVLLVEVPSPQRSTATLRSSLAGTPRMIGQAVGLLRRSRVLLALVGVELFWGFGMVTFEGLLPVRLAEVVGDADRAAALLGPTSSVAWLASAAGAALAAPVGRRLGVAPTAALLHLLQAGTVVGMGLLAGPAGVMVAYLACYAVHGAANPLHSALMHRQVDGPYRTSVLSLSSMMAHPSAAIGGITLTALAGATSISVAMLVGAAALALAAPLYLPAWRAGRREAAAGARPVSAPVGPAGTPGEVPAAKVGAGRRD